MTTEALYSELVQAGVLLKRADDGRLMADDTPALVPFREAIRQQKDALLEIVAKRDRMFYGWIGNCCVLSRRVSTSLEHFWLSYERFCVERNAAAVWADFERLIRTESEVVRGMVKGPSLKTDLDGYIPTVRLQ